MNKLFRSIILLTALCFPLSAVAQEIPTQKLPTFVTEIEKVFEEKEPKWKIKRPYVQMSPPVMHLKPSQGDILIYFWIMDSEKTAKEVFDGNAIAFRNIHGKRTTESKLPNFGDDNHLWIGASDGFSNFDFRKGNIYISVVAPSQAIAKKFGQYVLEHIAGQSDKNIKASK